MYLQDRIKSVINAGIIKDSSDVNKPLTRNLIKEELQNIVLNFIYNDKVYRAFIFTGGTCLRKVYGLNRLSEDLDFDYTNNLDLSKFAKDVKNYITTDFLYSNMSTKIATNGKSVFFKFPILKELGLQVSQTPQDIFLRCDFAKESHGFYSTEVNLVNAGFYSFFVNSFDLSTMFANKLTAFLERVFYKGEFQNIPFKGRDVYDIYWFIQLSAKSGYTLKPKTDRLLTLLKTDSTDQVKEQLRQKVKLVDQDAVYNDLLPLMESGALLEQFKATFKSTILTGLDFIL